MAWKFNGDKIVFNIKSNTKEFLINESNKRKITIADVIREILYEKTNKHKAEFTEIWIETGGNIINEYDKNKSKYQRARKSGEKLVSITVLLDDIDIWILKYLAMKENVCLGMYMRNLIEEKEK